MAFSLIAHGANGGTATVATLASAINTTGANLLVVSVGSQPGSVTAPTLTDSKSNTWTLIKAQVGSDVRTGLYAALNPTVGTGHQFTVTSAMDAAANPSLEVLAFSTGAGVASIVRTVV